MKIFFSSKTKLIKLAEDEDTKTCRLCSTPSQKNIGSLAVIPYSLEGEPTASSIRNKEIDCPTCNKTGKVKIGNPTYTECPTCPKGSISFHGIGQGPGIIKPSICRGSNNKPGCYNRGTIVVPKHGGNPDDTEEIPCPTCGGNEGNIPIKECPTCIDSDKPGFTQEGKSKHDSICPTCGGSTKTTTPEHYTPILQVLCPHKENVDTFTKPDDSRSTDDLGPFDRNYFEGRRYKLRDTDKEGFRVIPLKILNGIRGTSGKYHFEKKNEGLPKFRDTGPEFPSREVGVLTPPLPRVPRVRNGEEPSYLDLLSTPDLLDPDRTSRRNASNFFKRVKTSFNSKTAKPDTHEEPANPNNETSNDEFGDDFFGGIAKIDSTDKARDFDISDFIPAGSSINTTPQSTRGNTPEQQKRLHGGPITVRQMNESDMLRPFKNNPSKALEKTKSILKAQKTLSEKRSTMSKMFKGMKDLEKKTAIRYELVDNKRRRKDTDEQVKAKNKKRDEGLRPSYRGWRDKLQTVSENLDKFGQLRGTLRKDLSNVIGKRMDPVIATALTAQAFRYGNTVPGSDGTPVDLSQHRLGITEPMPYFKNDENWHEVHNGFGCDHDPGKGHEPDVGCVIDYHNPADNPKGGVTTGINSRLVTGKYTTAEGKTILQTVGARLKRARELGVAKQDLRGSIPKWTPESFGRVVELPSDRATCVPNRIQREHYVVDHTIEPPTEKAEYTSLPLEETGIKGLKPEPVLSKEKIKFPEDIREGGPTESVYVGNPLYQLNNPFSTQEVEQGMWANNPAVQHLAKQIKNNKRPAKFKPYVPEPKFNSQQKKTRPGLTGPPDEGSPIFDNFDLNTIFNLPGEKITFDVPNHENPPKTSKKEGEDVDPVEENADDTYNAEKKLKVQKMQRIQVHMVQPSNPSSPDITPSVPKINYN